MDNCGSSYFRFLAVPGDMRADFGEIGRRFRSKPATLSEQIGHPLRGGWSSAEFKPV